VNYKILLVDDDVLVRMGMKSAINWEAMRLDIVGEASDGGEALEMMATLQPDIVITDMYMPRFDGLRFIKEAITNFPGVVFVVISCHNDFQYIKESMRLGVYDYLLKSSIVNTNELEILLGNIVEMLDNRTEEAESGVEDIAPGIPLENQMLSYLRGQVALAHALAPQLKQYGIDYNSPNLFLIALRPDAYKSMLDIFGEKDLLEYAIQNILLEIVQKYGNGIVLPYKRRLFMALLCVNSKNNIISPADKALSICEWIRINIKNNIKSTCSVYLSEGTSFGELPLVYDSMLQEIESNSELFFDMVVNLCVQQTEPEEPGFSEAPNTDPISTVLKYIHENYREQITLEKLSSISHFSKYYLCKKFKEKTKTGIINYLQQVRIDKAKELLLQDHQKIFVVAQEVGFNDASYFNRVFKKETGHTPKEFIEFSSSVL